MRTSSSFTLRRAARSRRSLTSSGSCRCGRWVANAQYLQCKLQVRDNDRVTLREKVTRRRIRLTVYRAPILARPHGRRSPVSSLLLVVGLAGAAAPRPASDRPAERRRDAAARLRPQRRPRRHLRRARAARPRGGHRPACRARRLDRRALLLGRAARNFAVLDIHDLAIARERGRDLVGVMALVQRPLAAVLAEARSAGRATSRAAGSASPASLQRRRRPAVDRPPGDGGDPARGSIHDHRLQRGRSRQRPRRRGHRVLERRGRRAARADAGRQGVPRRRLRRPRLSGARRDGDAADAAAGPGPRAPRGPRPRERLRRRRQRSRGRCATSSRARPTSTRRRRGASSTRSGTRSGPATASARSIRRRCGRGRPGRSSSGSSTAGPTSTPPSTRASCPAADLRWRRGRSARASASSRSRRPRT